MIRQLTPTRAQTDAYQQTLSIMPCCGRSGEIFQLGGIGYCNRCGKLLCEPYTIAPGAFRSLCALLGLYGKDRRRG
jgi:hypothetical protein